MHLFTCLESKTQITYTNKINLNNAPISYLYKIKNNNTVFTNYDDLLKEYYSSKENILLKQAMIDDPKFNKYYLKSTIFNNYTYIKIKYLNIEKTCKIKNIERLNGEKKIFQRRKYKVIFAEPKFAISDLFRSAQQNENYDEIKLQQSKNNPLDLAIIDGPLFHIFTIVNIVRSSRWPTLPKSKKDIKEFLSGSIEEIKRSYVLYDTKDFLTLKYEKFCFSNQIVILTGEPINFIFNKKSKFKSDNFIFSIAIDSIKEKGSSHFHKFFDEIYQEEKIYNLDFYLKIFNREFITENNSYKKWLVEFINLKLEEFFKNGKLIEKYSLFSFNDILYIELEKINSPIENIKYNLNKLLIKYDLKILRLYSAFYIFNECNYIYKENNKIKYKLSFQIPKDFIKLAFNLKGGDILLFFEKYGGDSKMVTIFEFISGKYILNKLYNQLPYEFDGEIETVFCKYCLFLNYYQNMVKWCERCRKKF